MKWGVYHFAGEPHVNWHQFAQAIFDKAVEQQLLKKIAAPERINYSRYPTPAKPPSQLSPRLPQNFHRIWYSASDWQRALIRAYMPQQ